MTGPQHAAAPSPYATSVARTIVPVVWGHLIALLVSLGIPASVLSTHEDVVVEALAAALTAAWYTGWRLVEVKVPATAAWLRAMAWIALGHPATPTYSLPAVPTPAAPAATMTEPGPDQSR